MSMIEELKYLIASFNRKNLEMNSGLDIQGFFAVEPKKDCPHCVPENIKTVHHLLEIGVTVNKPCNGCGAQGEVWLCLLCGET